MFDATGTRRLSEDETPLLRALRGDEVTGAEMVIKRPDLDPVGALTGLGAPGEL